MAPLIVPNAALVRLIWSISGTPYAINVLGARKVSATTIDQAFANTLGAAVKARMTALITAAVHNTVSLASVGVRDISTANRPEFIDNTAAAAGTGTGKLLPLQVAICVTERTANAGKSFRGRYYQPGLADGGLEADGSCNGGTVTAIVSFIDSLRTTTFPASGLNLAVVSRKLLTVTDVTVVQSRNNNFETVRGRATAGV